MTVLRDISQVWSMAHVLVVFLLLFESRRPWRATVAICVSGAVVMSVVTLVVAAVLGLSPFAIIFFTCSLPSMALFFWISKYRNGRFFFLFCLSDTMCIWLIQVTSLLDRLVEGGYVVMLFSRLLLFPLAEWFIWKRLRRPYQELQRKLEQGWWLFSLIGLLYYLMLVMVSVPVDDPMPGWKGVLLLLLVLALMPLTYLSILHSLWRQMRMYENVRLMEVQRQDYDALCQKIEVGRIYRHDMRHHLAAVESMLQQEDSGGALQYIRALSGGLEELAEPVRCANPAVNAVLTACIVQAANVGCTVETRLRVPEQLPFEETDLCVILANALENAIHACQELPEDQRQIYLSVELTENRRLLISVENPCLQPVPFGPDGLPKVPHREGHGLGLQSVKRVTEKYGGLFRCQWEEGRFLFRTVLMPPAGPAVPKETRGPSWVAPVVLAALALLLVMNVLPAFADTLEELPLVGRLFLALDWRTYAAMLGALVLGAN